MAAIAVAAGVAPAAAQDKAPANQLRQVVFSGTGGISRGAYQAGVDWAISEVLRRQRDAAWRRKVLGESGPEFILAGTTGASAGNINAVFVAASWCAQSRNGQAFIKPEESLFWRAWIRTGVAQLMPAGSKDAAIFDRDFFYTSHLADLKEFLNEAQPVAGVCDIPVAVTVTKLRPAPVGILDNTLTAAVQRFAAPFRVSNTVTGGGIQFIEPLDSVKTSASLGALALLKKLDVTESAGARVDTVFNAVLASSAFPLAFAPVVVEFDPGGLARPLGKAEAGTLAPDERPEFVDGGVFDVNPVGLAARMYERHVAPGNRQTEIDLVYSNTQTIRRGATELDEALVLRDDSAPPNGSAPTSGASPGTSGLQAAVRLVSGAIGAARQYEMQTFARDRGRIAEIAKDLPKVLEVTTNPVIRRTTRNKAFFGATLGSFGGFLGRPLRERDFYAGVYDALAFVAQHLVCRVGIPDCWQDVHQRLVTDDVLELDDVAEELTKVMLSDEYGTVVPPSSLEPGSSEFHRLSVLRALDTALKGWNEKTCSAVRGFWERQLCAGGLHHALKEVKQNASVSLDALLKECQGIEAGECFVDEEFADLVKRPIAHVYSLSNKAATRMLDTEERLTEEQKKAKDKQRRGYPGVTKAAVAVHALNAHSYERSWAINPFVGPTFDWSHRWSSIVGGAVPNYVEVSLSPQHPPVGVLGYRPLVVFMGAPYVGTDLEWRFQRNGPDGGSTGAYLGVSTRRWWVSSLELGAARHFGQAPEARDPETWAAKFVVRGLWEKVRVATAFRGRDAWSVSVGVSDLNGLGYWLSRW